MKTAHPIRLVLALHLAFCASQPTTSAQRSTALPTPPPATQDQTEKLSLAEAIAGTTWSWGTSSGTLTFWPDAKASFSDKPTQFLAYSPIDEQRIKLSTDQPYTITFSNNRESFVAERVDGAKRSGARVSPPPSMTPPPPVVTASAMPVPAPTAPPTPLPPTATPPPPPSTMIALPAKEAVIQTLDGATYEDVTITRIDADALSFTHAAGVGMVDFENLPTALRTKYQYDPAKAVDSREARKRRNGAAIAAGRAMQQPPRPTAGVEQPVQVKPATPAASARRTTAQTFAAACAFYRLGDGDSASKAPQLQPGKVYRHYGYLRQVTNEMLLVDKIGLQGGEPWAVLVFEDPARIQAVPLESGQWVESIIRFKSFSNVPMANGTSPRLAVFTCLGFAPYGKRYVDTTGDASSSTDR